MSDDAEFPAKFVEGVVAHINEDHRGEMLAVAHGLAQQTWATDATLLHANKLGLDLVLRAEGREKNLRVLFDAPLEKTTQFRTAVIALIERARQQLPSTEADAPVMD